MLYQIVVNPSRMVFLRKPYASIILIGGLGHFPISDACPKAGIVSARTLRTQKADIQCLLCPQ